jgi:hypothetical protein
MFPSTRLRQVALVARQLGPVASRLRTSLGLGEPFRDEGVGEFGLENAVFAVGGTFLEVVAPVRDETTAGRYLDKRGGDGGYMAIFQVPDLAEARRRVAGLGVRVVWAVDLPDMGGTHLHPKDVPGAIVSLDWAEPAGSWRWAGPDWTGRVPSHSPGGIVGLTVETPEPFAVAMRWASVLGTDAETEADRRGAAVVLDAGRQRLRFVDGGAGRPAGISEVMIAMPDLGGESQGPVDIGGVRFAVVSMTEQVQA